MHVLSPILLVLGCLEDESGTAFPAADVVRFSGAELVAGEHDPLTAADRYQGGADDGYDWALASAGGTLYLGVPAAGEVRQFLGGKLAGGGGLFAAGNLGERFGTAVAARGKVVLVGAPEHDGGPELDGAGAVTLPDGTVLVGAAAQVAFGERVALCADIEGDGGLDWVASAPFEAGLGGAVYRGEVDDEQSALSALSRLRGSPGEGYGQALSCGDDLVDDTGADVVVGVPYSAGRTGADAAGRVEVWSRAAFELGLPKRKLFGEGEGANPDERFGTAVAACNLDGDADLDLVVGAPGADAGAGRIYVFRGKGLRESLAIGAVMAPSQMLIGEAEDGHFGDAIGCGDLSGDGVDELFVGAPGENAEDGTREIGALYAFAGPADDWGTAATTNLAFASFRSDRAFLRVGDRFRIDDLDGDGVADVMMVVRQRAPAE